MRWLVLLTWCVASSARAQFTAPEGCIDEPRLRQGVEAALGTPLDDVALTGAVSGGPGAWRASIEAGTEGVAPRRREVTSSEPSCAALDDALVVIAALLVDEVRLSRPAPPPPAVIEAPPPAPPPLPPVPGWTATLRLAALARIDELPGLAGAGALEVEVTPPGFVPIVLAAYFFPPVEAIRDGRGGRFVAGGGALGVCPVAAVDVLELGGCGALSALYVVGDGLGVEQPGQSAALSLGIEGTLVLRVRLHGALWARLGAGVLVPLSRIRSTLRVAGADVLVHEAAPVVPEGSLGLELRIP